MKNLLYKEFRLAMPLMTVLFLSFTTMTFIPGYPILCGAFFICFGLFQSYQFGREDNDILYTVLLPVKKSDAVKSKYAVAVVLQMAAFTLFATFTYIRMAFLSDVMVYTTNALMGANLTFLAFVLLIFTAFNVFFIGGFFKTAYKFGKPFVIFIIINFVLIGLAETLHHIPSLGWMNALDLAHAGQQLPFLLFAALLYVAATAASCKVSQNRFEKIDL